MKTAVRRFACGLSAGLALAAPAGAEVVDVPTADGGTWQMMIAPQGAKYDHPAVLRVALQEATRPVSKEVPDPIAIPDPPSAEEAAKAADATKADEEAAADEALKPAAPKDETPADDAKAEKTPADAEPADAEPADAAAAESGTPMPLPEPESSKPVYFQEAPPLPPAAVGSDFGMTILPQGRGQSAVDAAKQYAAVYRSIPFNRAEYVANPGYRHDAAMELLTGNQRLTAGYTGKTLALPKPGVYRPYLPSRREYLTAPFPYFGGAGFSGVGYGGIGNGGYSYTGPAAYGLGSLGYNGYVNPVLGGFGGFIGTGLNGNGLLGFNRLGRGSAFGGRPAAPAPMNGGGMGGGGMQGGVGHPVMPTPAD